MTMPRKVGILCFELCLYGIRELVSATPWSSIWISDHWHCSAPQVKSDNYNLLRSLSPRQPHCQSPSPKAANQNGKHIRPWPESAVMVGEIILTTLERLPVLKMSKYKVIFFLLSIFNTYYKPSGAIKSERFEVAYRKFLADFLTTIQCYNKAESLLDANVDINCGVWQASSNITACWAS